jgi:hypothetical protein
MKKNVKILLNKSIDSLVLSVEHFNRPWDRGREEAVLIFLDRAFELFLKAIILHKGGQIRDRGASETYGFDRCVRKCISDKAVKCLTEEEALAIQIINSLRDAAQHYILSVSENQLYMYAQAGITLFNDKLKRIFDKKLSDFMPDRVLPVSTIPPASLGVLVNKEFKEIKQLIKPGLRKKIQARAKLRSIAIIEASLKGIRSQPSKYELDKYLDQAAKGKKWQDIFPGVACLKLDTNGTGLSVSIKITKSEGEPVQMVPEGTPGATVVAVKRVNELDYYSLGAKPLAKKLGLTQPKTYALIKFLKIQESDEYYKEIRIGRIIHKRYSQKALDFLKNELKTVDMMGVWEKCKPGCKK